jgi:hypothetical protein
MDSSTVHKEFNSVAAIRRIYNRESNETHRSNIIHKLSLCDKKVQRKIFEPKMEELTEFQRK